MARNWPRVRGYDTPEEVDEPPPGWRISQIESLYEQLAIGKRFDQKSSATQGLVPVIDQSADGILGWHNEDSWIDARIERPVVTFANHTCEMRMMRRPFSVIQNVFPMVGKPGVCVTEFLYYGTKGRVFLEEYKGHYPDFRRKWILLPPLPEQRAIARVLGTLDDKIELNRKMIETLEELARTLFKSWFVDFDPVHAKAAGKKPFGMNDATAALFPDSFEDSELGPIPRGWRVGTLGEVASVRGGEQLDRTHYATRGPFPVFGANGEMGRTHRPNIDGVAIAFGRVGANCGSIHWTSDGAWINNNASLVQARTGDHWWLLSLMLSIDWTTLRAGSAQPFISQGSLFSARVLVPCEASRPQSRA